MYTSLGIKELPLSERPYEKLERYGPEVLSNAELMAIIIKTGNKNESSVNVAQRILKKDEGERGMAFLHDLSLNQLMEIKGIGRVKAIQIKALLEISKRISTSTSYYSRIIVKTPGDASKLLMEEMRYLKKEIFKGILLNTKNHVEKIIDISIGSLNASIVHPREAFSEAVKSGISSVVFIHNHPSGDPEPSMEDIETTNRLVEAGKILGIKLLDHIIIGDGRFTSLKEKGWIE